MNLILVALPHSGLPELSAEIQNNFAVQVEIIEKDLCNTESCEEVFSLVKSKGLKVTVLINNLGGAAQSHLLWATSNNTRSKLSSMYFRRCGFPICSSAFYGQTPAYILNVGSLAAYFTVPQKGVYSASKSFIISFSKTLREELREDWINVSVVCPSGMRPQTLYPCK